MFNSIKNKKLEMLKDMLGRRTGYAEAVSSLSLEGKEKDVFLRASIEVKKNRPNKEIIEEAYTILVSKSLDMDESKLITSSNENIVDENDLMEEVQSPQENSKLKVTSKQSNLLKYILVITFILIILITIYLFKDLLMTKRVDNINFRNNLAYEINTKEPFSGIVFSQYENKQKREEESYKNGKLNGTSKKWYENGKKEEEASYQNEKLNGTSKKWYENGQKEEEASYQNGKLNGTSKKWYENGGKEEEASYQNGKLNGNYTEWSYDNHLSQQGKYLDGKADGVITQYDEKGKVKFKINEAVSKKCVDFANGSYDIMMKRQSIKHAYQADQISMTANTPLEPMISLELMSSVIDSAFKVEYKYQEKDKKSAAMWFMEQTLHYCNKNGY